MRPQQPRHPAPPTSADELLHDLRAARLLSSRRARKLRARWARGPAPGGGAEDLTRELVAAGTLTPYQAGHVLAGRACGLRLGQYRILERLGGGGMGQVFKAEHRLMKRVVALKVIARLRGRGRGGAAARAEAVGRFRREVEAAARLRHPTIVTAHDAAAARGRLFLDRKSTRLNSSHLGISY